MDGDVKTLLAELDEFESGMSREDRFDFEMLKKREKDSEEFDKLSIRRVSELHKKYVVKKMVKDIDSLLKKYTKQVKESGPGKDPSSSGQES